MLKAATRLLLGCHRKTDAEPTIFFGGGVGGGSYLFVVVVKVKILFGFLMISKNM